LAQNISVAIKDRALLSSNVSFFAKALEASCGLQSCIEFGANIGMNLRALQILYPDIKLHGIEINPHAAQQLSQFIGPEQVTQASILDVDNTPVCDLSLIKGVLIRINPDALPRVYQKLVAATRRYLLVSEYYNPTPVKVSYRGHSDRLFKRDFSGEIMDLHPEMQLVDYGFVYHRDPKFPQDDTTWFLLEKK